MDKYTIIIIALVGMIWCTLLLILAEKIDSLYDKFDTKNKEDKNARQ